MRIGLVGHPKRILSQVYFSNQSRIKVDKKRRKFICIYENDARMHDLSTSD